MDEKLSDEFFINSIIFDENPIMAIKQYDANNLFYDELLTLLDSFINKYNNMQMFDDYITSNILNIISYIKYNYHYSNLEEKKNKYNLYNKYIINLNNGLKVNSEVFYLSQCLDRGIIFNYNCKLDDVALPDNMKEIVRISLCYDKFFYDILLKDVNNVSDSEFSVLTMNSLFIYSVNYFYVVCPCILEKNGILKEILIKNNKKLGLFKSIFVKQDDILQRKNLRKSSKKLLKKIRWS